MVYSLFQRHTTKGYKEFGGEAPHSPPRSSRFSFLVPSSTLPRMHLLLSAGPTISSTEPWDTQSYAGLGADRARSEAQLCPMTS